MTPASHPPKGIRRAKVGDRIRICNDSNGVQPANLSPYACRVDEINADGIPCRLTAHVGQFSPIQVAVPHPSRLKFIIVSP